MLKLNLTKKTKWVEMPDGVSIEVIPFSSAGIVGCFSDGLEEKPQKEQGYHFMVAIACNVIVNWKGVGDENGNPVPVTDEWVKCLLEDFSQFTAFQSQVGVEVVKEIEEKKLWKPSLNGSSEGGKNTARPARKSVKPAHKK